jgi:hypothetical protein
LCRMIYRWLIFSEYFRLDGSQHRAGTVFPSMKFSDLTRLYKYVFSFLYLLLYVQLKMDRFDPYGAINHVCNSHQKKIMVAINALILLPCYQHTFDHVG